MEGEAYVRAEMTDGACRSARERAGCLSMPGRGRANFTAAFLILSRCSF